MGQNWPCRSPGDKGILGLQGQGSDCGLDMVSRGHSQAVPYRTLPGRLRRQRGESDGCHIYFNHPAQVSSHVHRFLVHPPERVLSPETQPPPAVPWFTDLFSQSGDRTHFHLSIARYIGGWGQCKPRSRSSR